MKKMFFKKLEQVRIPVAAGGFRTRLLCSLVCLVCCGIQFSRAQENWKQTRNKDGIQVFTRSTDSSDFKSVKVLASLQGSVEKLIQVLFDVDRHTSWVYETRKARILSRNDSTDILYYAETRLPWPIHNRDAVIRMQLLNYRPDSSARIVTIGQPDAAPRVDGLVRVPLFKGLWEVRKEGDRSISIVYFIDVDPGGSLPAWISNLFVSKGPFETFSALSRRLRQ